ncbi:MAG: SGNH/GDSL hydrolase family protein [Candidatus Paceibacteria bacterium]
MLETRVVKKEDLASLKNFSFPNKTIGLPNRPLKIGAIGDSITRNQITYGDTTWGTYYGWVGRNWLLRTGMKLQGKAWVDIYSVEGYSGQRTDEIYDSMLSPTAVINATHVNPQPIGVLANKPDICIEFSGTNDNYLQVNTKEQMVAGRRAIWARLMENGITPVVLSLLPNDLNDIRNTRIPEWNLAIKEECEKMNIVYVDIYTNCSNNGKFKTGWNFKDGVVDIYDGLHPGAEACESIAVDVSTVLLKLIGTRISTPTVMATGNIYSKTADLLKGGEEYKLFDTGLFPTVGVWTPRYENAYLTSTRSVISEPAFTKFGNVLTIDYQAVSSGEGYSDMVSSPISVTEGEKYGIFLKMNFEAKNKTDGIQLGISYNNEYDKLITYFTGGSANGASSSVVGASIGGIYYQEIIIPKGCTSIRIFHSLGVSAGGLTGQKMKLSNVGSVKVNAKVVNEIGNVNQNTVVIDGDSIAAMNGYVANPDGGIATDSGGFVAWANIKLNNKLHIIANHGVSGERTDQLLARLQTSIDLKPKFMIINIGTNDVGQNVAKEIIKANLLTIINRIRSAGIICVINTILPRDDSNSENFATEIFYLNNFLRDLQGTLDNYILFDGYASIVSPATNLPRANTLVDGVHPSAQGAPEIGYELANSMDKYLKPISLFSGGNTDIATGYLNNPYMLGGTTVATGWTGNIDSGAGVFTKVARDYGLEWQQINMTTLGVFTMYNYIQGIVVGDKIQVITEFELDDDAVIDKYTMRIEAKAQGNIGINGAHSIFIDEIRPIRFSKKINKGILATPVFTVPAGTFDLILFLSAKLTGKIRFGRNRIIKVS